MRKTLDDLYLLLEKVTIHSLSALYEYVLLEWNSRRSLPLILMHTRTLKTYLSGGGAIYFANKDYKVWYFS